MRLLLTNERPGGGLLFWNVSYLGNKSPEEIQGIFYRKSWTVNYYCSRWENSEEVCSCDVTSSLLGFKTKLVMQFIFLNKKMRKNGREEGGGERRGWCLPNWTRAGNTELLQHLESDSPESLVSCHGSKQVWWRAGAQGEMNQPQQIEQGADLVFLEDLHLFNTSKLFWEDCTWVTKTGLFPNRISVFCFLP